MLKLIPPPDYVIKGPVITNNNTYPIPPLNTSNIFIVVYYDAGQEIILSQASGLQGACSK